jgi:hypothetical protein
MTLQSILEGMHGIVPILDSDGDVVANLSVLPVNQRTASVPFPSPLAAKHRAVELKEHIEEKVYSDGHAVALWAHPYSLDTNITGLRVAMFDNVRTPFHTAMPMWVYAAMAWEGPHIVESAQYDVEAMMQGHFVQACLLVDCVYDPTQKVTHQLKWWLEELTPQQRCHIISTMHCLVSGALLYVEDITRKMRGDDTPTDAWVYEGPSEVGGDDCESLAALVLHHISLFRCTIFEHPILEHERELMIEGYVTLFVICVLQMERGQCGYHVTVVQVDREWLEFVCGYRKVRPRTTLASKLLESTAWIDHNRNCKPARSSLASDLLYPVPSRPRIGTDEVVPDSYQMMQIAVPCEKPEWERIDFIYQGKTGVPMDRFMDYDYGIEGCVTEITPKARALTFTKYTRSWPNLQPFRPPAPGLPPLQFVELFGVCSPQTQTVAFESWYRYIDWEGGATARAILNCKQLKLRGLAVWLMHLAHGCRAIFVRGYTS